MDTNLNEAAYKDAILSFLKNKYNEQFEIIELYLEFNGDIGLAVRALCKSSAYTDTFLSYCYFDPSMTDEKVKIDENEYSLDDEYSEVVLQNKLLLLVDQAYQYDESIFVGCKVGFLGRYPSADELNKGMEFCLHNDELRAHVKFYILTSGSSKAKELQGKVEDFIVHHRPYKGYVYYAVSSKFNKADIVQEYFENQHDFGNYLTSSNLADTVEFTLYKIDAGLQERRIVKEG